MPLARIERGLLILLFLGPIGCEGAAQVPTGSDGPTRSDGTVPDPEKFDRGRRLDGHITVTPDLKAVTADNRSVPRPDVDVSGCPYGPPTFHGPVAVMNICEACMQAAIAACHATGSGYRLVSGHYPPGRDWGWGPSLACSGPSGSYSGTATTQGQTTWFCFSPAQQQASMIIAGGIVHVFVSP